MRRALAGLLLSALVAAVGCSSYPDFQRPLLRNYAADLVCGTSRPQEGRKAVSERSKRLAEAVARRRAMAGEPKEQYTVGRGDVLSVFVLVPTQPGTGTVIQLPVSEDGDVTVPLLGKVGIAGLTTGQIEERLTSLYSDGYYRDPVVSVVVSTYASKQVLVTGAVADPRVVVLKANRISLLEALSQAGGLAEEAGGIARVTRLVDANPANPADAASAGSVEVDLDRLVAGDMQQNVWIYPDDVVYVAPSRTEYYYVVGYVRLPGAYPLPNDGVTLGMMNAIAFAHGLSPAGRSENTYLLRRTGGGEKRHRVDLTRVAAAKDQDIVIEPDDIIVVGTSWGRRTLDGFLHAIGLRSLAPTAY